MTPLSFEIQACREWSLEMIHRFLQGRFDHFRIALPARWAEERETVWADAYRATVAGRRSEQEQRGLGKPIPAQPCDPRRLPRLLGRLCKLCLEGRDEEPFRNSIAEALTAYRDPCITAGEARYINFLPSIPVFERPLPAGSSHRYPCHIDDIRRQLALVPEYDLEGIGAIGLAPPDRAKSDAYGVYRRRYYPTRKHILLLHPIRGTGDFKLGVYNSGDIKRRFQVEIGYGMQIKRKGRSATAHWSQENIRRFIVNHVLLHEIGHHVQFQQREREQLRRWLPKSIKEQFAEDYAIRFNRERMEEQSSYNRRSFGVK